MVSTLCSIYACTACNTYKEHAEMPEHEMPQRRQRQHGWESNGTRYALRTRDASSNITPQNYRGVRNALRTRDASSNITPQLPRSQKRRAETFLTFIVCILSPSSNVLPFEKKKIVIASAVVLARFRINNKFCTFSFRDSRRVTS
jgi:hypothetical protein